LVPPLVARAIDTTTHPLRTAREVFEEVEEITFSLKRTRKVTFNAEQSTAAPRRPAAVEVQASSSRRGEPSTAGTDPYALAASDQPSVGHRTGGELMGRERALELRGRNGPRELPPTT
jgi:hypothetical protein